MAEAAHGAHGDMDISDQEATFSGFLAAGLWGATHIAQAVALATLAFAIGAGWWAGLLAVAVIGVGVGLFFRMGGVWWAVQIAQIVLLGLGGIIVPLITGLMH
ncbi:MAG: aa3-type cytochrome c oxidase subunit IV [Alphaproteobacteria bacterium]